MAAESQPSSDTPKRSEPQSFRARELTASLTVNDIQRSLAWYREIVGFTVEREYGSDGQLAAVGLKAGGTHLLLTQDDGAQGWDRVKGVGLSLYFTTAQDVDQLAEGIVSRGGSLRSEPSDTPWGSRVFRMEDPDGFRIVIGSERGGES